MEEAAAPAVHTVADLVAQAADRSADHPALVAGPVTLSWAELDALVDRAASALRQLGLAPGDRIVLQLGNSTDFPALYYGALRAGLVAVPANVAYTGPELAHLLSDSGAVALVTSSVQVIATADTLRTGPLRHVLVAAPSGPDGTLPLPGLLAAAPPLAFRHVPRSPEDLAVLAYTSGTSGRPRGAMLTHRALLANLAQCAALRPAPVTAQDVLLLAVPLFHAYGLNPGLGLLARAGATGVLVEHFDPAETLELIRRQQVTAVPAVPAMYVRWAREPGLADAFAGVRLATSGAAPLPPETLLAFADAGVTVFEGYGLTEAAPVLTSTLVGGAAKPGSVGRPVPGVELRLREVSGMEPDPEPDDDAGPGELDLIGSEAGPGEIVVRGPNLFSGYWPQGTDGPDPDGWWATGDVAYADDDGDLHLVDRRTELILVRGFNVYPAEVEAVLAAHPTVAEAAVLGRPDEEHGERVVAYVVAAEGASPGEQELLDWAARSLARFKLPASIEFVPDLPHSATGKVIKARLR
ncbi:MAG TPA: AMP-binding protein [Mycobacteriales bacterium]|nr:AMP-binding protein [Mycobacteriales bacterium]